MVTSVKRNYPLPLWEPHSLSPTGLSFFLYQMGILLPTFQGYYGEYPR